MRKRSVEILWFLILMALLLVMAYLLWGGGILLLLAPRMVPMVWFGFAVLLVLYVFQALQLVRGLRRQPGRGNGKASILMYIIPLLLFITVTPNQSTPGMLPNQNVSIMSLNSAEAASTADAGETTGPQPADATAQTNGSGAELDNAASVSAAEVKNLASCVLDSETTSFHPSDDSFSKYLQSEVKNLIGKTITVYGYVYTSDSFPENTILIARTMIACCAADASIVGFHVKVDKDAGLVNNEWIRVTGTVRSFVMDYYGATYDSPILTDGLILRCDAPTIEDTYIYP